MKNAMTGRSLRPWISLTVIVACAILIAAIGDGLDTARGLTVTVVVVVTTLCILNSAPGRVFSVSVVFVGLFSWLLHLTPLMLAEPMARAWWPWLTVQPLTSLLFVCSLGLLVVLREEDLAKVRPASAIVGAGVAAFYGFGLDYSVVTGRPWLFEICALSAPALLAMIPLERWSRAKRMLYAASEPLIVVVGVWLALLTVLKARESATYFLLGWFLPVFALPCAVAVVIRILPGVLTRTRA